MKANVSLPKSIITSIPLHMGLPMLLPPSVPIHLLFQFPLPIDILPCLLLLVMFILLWGLLLTVPPKASGIIKVLITTGSRIRWLCLGRTRNSRTG